MKKLIMTLTVVAIATIANAAAFNWTSGGLGATAKTINSVGGTALYSTETAYTLYLFDAGVVSQSALLTALRDGNSITDFTAVKSQTLASNSQVTPTSFTYGDAGTQYSFYMAVVNGDDVFLSSSVSSLAQASDTVNVSFSGLGSATKVDMGEASYSTAGWYSAVPEPTSGLLMLVGLAGLALRRRRA